MDTPSHKKVPRFLQDSIKLKDPTLPHFLFNSFRLDVGNAVLWRGKRAVFVTPKAFNVLCYLIEHADQLVSKHELWQAVWPGISVTDAALTVCISEIRKALGDEAKTPRYIETVHRLGYRFVAPVSTAATTRLSAEARAESTLIERRAPGPDPPVPTSFVGREADLARLRQYAGKAMSGERQVVFVSGEPGIGKTTLVEVFLQQLAASGSYWIGRGQCIQHYGIGEAYLPLLEALRRLSRGTKGARFQTLLEKYAPSWIIQIPSLISAAKREALLRTLPGITRERMMRELAEAVEILTAERGLVLWLEDLHWSDQATMDWLAFVARRRETARLLIIGAYRPVDVILRAHPLRTIKQELALHGYCSDLPLQSLTQKAVSEYLIARFGSKADLPFRELAKMIYRRTEGNPLFMINVVDYAVAGSIIAEHTNGWRLNTPVEILASGVPTNLRELIDQELERLTSTEQRDLEAAGVAGQRFSAAAVAAAVNSPIDAVEERLNGLIRRGLFLRENPAGEWPDGTVASAYTFLHSIHREVLYERVSVVRRVSLHLTIAQRLEKAHGAQAKEIAAELAEHYERGRSPEQAVKHLWQAAKNAGRRHAPHEVITVLNKGLKLLATLPDTHQRARQELDLRMTLGHALMAARGQAAPEMAEAYNRARELSTQLGETTSLFHSLSGLLVFTWCAGNYERPVN